MMNLLRIAALILAAMASTVGASEPIWIVLNGEVVKLDPEASSILERIPSASENVAADNHPGSGEFAVLSTRELTIYDSTGQVTKNVPLPFAPQSAHKGVRFHGDTGQVVVWDGSNTYYLSTDGSLRSFHISNTPIREIKPRQDSGWYLLGAHDIYEVDGDLSLSAQFSAQHSAVFRDIASVDENLYLLTNKSVHPVDMEARRIGSAITGVAPSSFMSISSSESSLLFVSPKDIAKLDTSSDNLNLTEVLPPSRPSRPYIDSVKSSDGGFYYFSQKELYGLNELGISRNIPAVEQLVDSGSSLVAILASQPDREPPTIRFASPLNGSWINPRPTLVLEHYDDQSGIDPKSLTLRLHYPSEPMDFECSSSSDVSNCTPTNNLPEELLILTAEIYDNAGNKSARASVFYRVDYTPPLLPPAEVLIVEYLDDGRVRLVGRAGSIESNVYLDITNTRTSETITTRANSDGSFDVILNGTEDDVYELVARDEAGNTSQRLEYKVPGDVPYIVIFSPDPGSSHGETVTIHGRLIGDKPKNTGVSAGGVPALLDEDGFFAINGVPLVQGENDLTILASHLGGPLVQKTLPLVSSYQSVEGAEFDVRVVENLPSYVTYYIGIKLPDGIDAHRIGEDRDFDGEIDQYHSAWGSFPYDATTSIRSYQPGDAAYDLREVKIGIETQEGERHIFSKFTKIHRKGQLLDAGQVVWDHLAGALRNRDQESILSAFDEVVRYKYQPAFSDLSSIDEQVINNVGQLRFGRSGDRHAELLIPLDPAASDQAFIMRIEQSSDGVWRITKL